MTHAPSIARIADLDRVRALIARGSDALGPYEGTEAWRFGAGFWSFTPEEHGRLEKVRDRIESYLNLTAHKRPLCVAVFGPPGSGKSSGVKEIFRQLKAGGAPLGWAEHNLTQFHSTDELARAVAGAIQGPNASSSNSVPFIFFDEFDASLNGAPLGWLSWFLAPMQDGQFVADGKELCLEKAVYVFAGGTAATMEEFGTRDAKLFRDAKGPDFVSRLHVFIDVRGPNDPSGRVLRRGMAVRFALDAIEKRTGRRRDVDDEILNDLVSAGRYRYGQRSVEAVVTMIAEEVQDPAMLCRQGLPPDFLLDMQVDRGPLDAETIGGLVGLSGGGFPSPKQREDRDELWVGLAKSVWASGATVAYGGNWDPNGLTQALIDVPLPRRLRRTGDDGSRLEIHAMTPPPAAMADTRATIVMVPQPVVAGAAGPVRRAAHLFRMRWQSGCRCRARVLLSGKTEGFTGRMPGIIEEAMIALALRQPIYVLGGLGGAAALLGELLGLSTSPSAPTKLKPLSAPRLDSVAQLFRPTGFEDLPLTTADALLYVASRAIGGPGWVPNGLTVDENRELFALGGAGVGERERAIRLVRRGLLRTFDA